MSKTRFRPVRLATSHRLHLRLVEAGFLISPKSVLDPVQLVSFLGRSLNLALRTVACHTQALLQLWVGWMRLALGDGGGWHLRSYLGLLN